MYLKNIFKSLIVRWSFQFRYISSNFRFALRLTTSIVRFYERKRGGKLVRIQFGWIWNSYWNFSGPCCYSNRLSSKSTVLLTSDAKILSIRLLWIIDEDCIVYRQNSYYSTSLTWYDSYHLAHEKFKRMTVAENGVGVHTASYQVPRKKKWKIYQFWVICKTGWSDIVPVLRRWSC